MDHVLGKKSVNSCTRTWRRHRNSTSLFLTSHNNKSGAKFFVTVIKGKTRSAESCGCLCSAVLSISKSQCIATSKFCSVEGGKQRAIMLNEARTVAKVQFVTQWNTVIDCRSWSAPEYEQWRQPGTVLVGTDVIKGDSYMVHVLLLGRHVLTVRRQWDLIDEGQWLCR